MKQDTPVLVILGNPPYNGSRGHGGGRGARAFDRLPQDEAGAASLRGRGLNDLYVRFFRMAERRITEKTGQGVVCFISNYSWLDGLSFTGMREHFLREFDDDSDRQSQRRQVAGRARSLRTAPPIPAYSRLRVTLSAYRSGLRSRRWCARKTTSQQGRSASATCGDRPSVRG